MFDGRAAWGQSSNDATVAGSTGGFDTDRWLLRARLTGDFTFGRMHVAPHVGVIYFQEEQASFTTSQNVFIAGQTVDLGRMTFGPKISTSIAVGNGATISPHLGIKGIWDFEKAEIVDLTTGLTAGSDDFRGRVEGGVAMHLANGWNLTGEGFYDGIGADDFDSYGGSVRLNVPLN